jgi:hypothetical protein
LLGFDLAPLEGVDFIRDLDEGAFFFFATA